MSIAIYCEILKKKVSILDCVFNCSYCVTESFEDIIITFPGYPRTVWKRDLNAETRLLRLIPIFGMVYFEFNPRRKTEMYFFFSLTFTIKMSIQGFYK